MKDLLRKLAKVDNVSLHWWNDLRELRDNYSKGLCVLKSVEICDKYSIKNRDNMHEALKDVSNWSTYQECFKLLYISNNGLEAHVTIWNGENMSGRKTDLRWKAVFTGINTIPEGLPKALDYRLQQEAERMYEESLAAKRKLEILKIYNELNS